MECSSVTGVSVAGSVVYSRSSGCEKLQWHTYQIVFDITVVVLFVKLLYSVCKIYLTQRRHKGNPVFPVPLLFVCEVEELTDSSTKPLHAILPDRTADMRAPCCGAPVFSDAELTRPAVNHYHRFIFSRKEAQLLRVWVCVCQPLTCTGHSAHMQLPGPCFSMAPYSFQIPFSCWPACCPPHSPLLPEHWQDIFKTVHGGEDLVIPFVFSSVVSQPTRVQSQTVCAG